MLTYFRPRRSRFAALCLIISCSAWLSACDRGADAYSRAGLPAGDPVAGQAAFVALRCNDCHSTSVVRLRDAEQTDIHVPLGQAPHDITNERSLLMAIISPSHRISVPIKPPQSGGSPMPPYADVMLVQELIDIMAMLRPEFGLAPLALAEDSP